MRVDERLLLALDVRASEAERFLPELRLALPQHGIDTPLRIAHFLAQVVHESGRMTRLVENLNYSAQRLLEVFPSRFTKAQAAAYAGKPERIGNRVYGDRLGNGHEASGDGYRYRGRGLIQLTGKTNYRAFSSFLREDVVRAPDLVATKYPVRSAVYFWTERDLNRWADADDISTITLEVNGPARRGLAERTALLYKAKRALASEDPALEQPTHRVIPLQLNLRRSPDTSAATKIGVLTQGSEVVVLAKSSVPGWVRIRTKLGEHIVEGFVSSTYLAPIGRAAGALVRAAAAPRAGASRGALARNPALVIPAVHLAQNATGATRKADAKRAFPLHESNSPRRKQPSAASLIQIVNYLDSSNSKHLRYRPKPGTTFCNIYAYDYCYLAGVYLPRVWWTPAALTALQAGEQLPVQYGKTVRELNANALLDWLQDHGALFGWQRETSLEVLQATANQGQVCLIVAQRSDLNSPGHISAVVPEHKNYRARRNSQGVVLRPLESQAGRTNYRYVTKSSAWWTAGQYGTFGFFRHS